MKLSQEEMEEILNHAKVIAIVGLSSEPDKPSFEVAAYLKQHSYQIIPVNPFVDKVLGEKSFKNLLEIPLNTQKIIDVVNIFRRPDTVPLIVDQAIKLKSLHGKPNAIWMQIGVVNEQAAQTARKAGLTVIMDKCIMKQHRQTKNLFPASILNPE
jgi:predicted CoA-binding protein